MPLASGSAGQTAVQGGDQQGNAFLDLLGKRKTIEQQVASRQAECSTSSIRAQARRHLRQRIRDASARGNHSGHRLLALLSHLTTWAEDRAATALPFFPELVAFFVHDLAVQDPKKQDLGLYDLSLKNALDHFTLSPNKRRSILKDLEWLRAASEHLFFDVPEAQASLFSHPAVQALCRPVPRLDTPHAFKKYASKKAKSKNSSILETANQHEASDDPNSSNASVELPAWLLPNQGEYHIQNAVLPTGKRSNGRTAPVPSTSSNTQASFKSSVSMSQTGQKPSQAPARLTPRKTITALRRPLSSAIVIDTDEEQVADHDKLSANTAENEEADELQSSDDERLVEEALIPPPLSEASSPQRTEKTARRPAQSSELSERPQESTAFTTAPVHSTSDRASASTAPAPATAGASLPRPKSIEKTVTLRRFPTPTTSGIPVRSAAKSPNPPSPIVRDALASAQKASLSSLSGKTYFLTGDFASGKPSVITRAYQAGASLGSLTNTAQIHVLAYGSNPNKSIVDLLAIKHRIPVMSEVEFEKLLPQSSAGPTRTASSAHQIQQMPPRPSHNAGMQRPVSNIQSQASDSDSDASDVDDTTLYNVPNQSHRYPPYVANLQALELALSKIGPLPPLRSFSTDPSFCLPSRNRQEEAFISPTPSAIRPYGITGIVPQLANWPVTTDLPAFRHPPPRPVPAGRIKAVAPWLTLKQFDTDLYRMPNVLKARNEIAHAPHAARPCYCLGCSTLFRLALASMARTNPELVKKIAQSSIVQPSRPATNFNVRHIQMDQAKQGPSRVLSQQMTGQPSMQSTPRTEPTLHDPTRVAAASEHQQSQIHSLKPVMTPSNASTTSSATQKLPSNPKLLSNNPPTVVPTSLSGTGATSTQSQKKRSHIADETVSSVPLSPQSLAKKARLNPQTPSQATKQSIGPMPPQRQQPPDATSTSTTALQPIKLPPSPVPAQAPRSQRLGDMFAYAAWLTKHGLTFIGEKQQPNDKVKALRESFEQTFQTIQNIRAFGPDFPFDLLVFTESLFSQNVKIFVGNKTSHITRMSPHTHQLLRRLVEIINQLLVEGSSHMWLIERFRKSRPAIERLFAGLVSGKIPFLQGVLNEYDSIKNDSEMGPAPEAAPSEPKSRSEDRSTTIPQTHEFQPPDQATVPKSTTNLRKPDVPAQSSASRTEEPQNIYKLNEISKKQSQEAEEPTATTRVSEDGNKSAKAQAKSTSTSPELRPVPTRPVIPQHLHQDFKREAEESQSTDTTAHPTDSKPVGNQQTRSVKPVSDVPHGRKRTAMEVEPETQRQSNHSSNDRPSLPSFNERRSSSSVPPPTSRHEQSTPSQKRKRSSPAMNTPTGGLKLVYPVADVRQTQAIRDADPTKRHKRAGSLATSVKSEETHHSDDENVFPHLQHPKRQPSHAVSATEKSFTEMHHAQETETIQSADEVSEVPSRKSQARIPVTSKKRAPDSDEEETAANKILDDDGQTSTWYIPNDEKATRSRSSQLEKRVPSSQANGHRPFRTAPAPLRKLASDALSAQTSEPASLFD